ncbi:hypothetical protein Bbelb_071050 [Branchiostoma belcheri]|nr:hypothetical protein Bbelb_071050 [Branchiostoma belcheri]
MPCSFRPDTIQSRHEKSDAFTCTALSLMFVLSRLSSTYSVSALMPSNRTTSFRVDRSADAVSANTGVPGILLTTPYPQWLHFVAHPGHGAQFSTCPATLKSDYPRLGISKHELVLAQLHTFYLTGSSVTERDCRNPKSSGFSNLVFDQGNQGRKDDNNGLSMPSNNKTVLEMAFSSAFSRVSPSPTAAKLTEHIHVCTVTNPSGLKHLKRQLKVSVQVHCRVKEYIMVSEVQEPWFSTLKKEEKASSQDKSAVLKTACHEAVAVKQPGSGRSDVQAFQTERLHLSLANPEL